MDIADPTSVEQALEATRPWAVINTAGYVRVDEAETDRAICERENRDGPICLATACGTRGIPLLTFSTDLVFDGQKSARYMESDPVNPLGVYGAAKAAAERAVLDVHPGALVIRTSAFFGPWDQHNFVTVALREMRAGHTFPAAGDCTASPTYVPELVDAALDLLMDQESGIWHLANDGQISWAELARAAAERAGIPHAGLLKAVPSCELPFRAQRPRNSAMASERCQVLGTLEHALDRYFIQQQ